MIHDDRIIPPLDAGAADAVRHALPPLFPSDANDGAPSSGADAMSNDIDTLKERNRAASVRAASEYVASLRVIIHDMNETPESRDHAAYAIETMRRLLRNTITDAERDVIFGMTP